MGNFSGTWKAVTIAALVLTSYQPVQAATFKAPSVIVAGEGVTVDVRKRRKVRRGVRCRGSKRCFRSKRIRRSGRHFHGGRYHRRGRHYGGNVAAGIIGGIIVGGIIAESNRHRRYHSGHSNAHRRWCHNRYRSYNSRTNTWVAYSGRVRQCHSPYN